MTKSNIAGKISLLYR